MHMVHIHTHRQNTHVCKIKKELKYCWCFRFVSKQISKQTKCTLKEEILPGMVVIHTFDPSTEEAEAANLYEVQASQGYMETLSQINRTEERCEEREGETSAKEQSFIVKSKRLFLQLLGKDSVAKQETPWGPLSRGV